MPLLNDNEQVTSATVPLLPPADDPVELAYENMGTFKRLGRAFERGRRIHQQGILGSTLRDAPSPDAVTRLDEVSRRVDELGGDGPGFVGWLGSAAEIVGQVSDTLLRPATPEIRESARLYSPGDVIQLYLSDIMLSEGGHSYIEQIELGVDPDVARWTSFGVGVLNAGLELAGVAGVTAPFSKATKELLKSGVRKAMSSPRVLMAARRAFTAYGTAIGSEVSTEVVQEAVQIAAAELGKSLTSDELEGISADEIAERLGEIAFKTFQGMTVLAIPGAGASIVSDIQTARQAQNNRENLDKLRETVQTVKDEDVSTQLETALDQVDLKEVYIPADQLVKAATDSGNPATFYQSFGADGSLISQIEDTAVLGGDIRLDTRRFTQLLQSDIYDSLADHIRFDPDGMTAAEAKEFEESGIQDEIERLGLDEPQITLRKASEQPSDEGAVSYDILGQDGTEVGFAELTITGNTAYVNLIDTHEAKRLPVGTKTIRDFVRQLVEDYPEVEFISGERISGARVGNAAKARTPDEEIDLTVVPVSTFIKEEVRTLAEEQMGLQALFKTANEAGMTDRAYEGYLVALQKAADSRGAARERRRLRVELKEVKAEQDRIRAELAEVARESVSSQPVYSALHAIGREQLNRAKIVEIIGEEQLSQLPKQNGRNIYTGKRDRGGIDPALHAEMFGFEGADIMLFSMIDAKPFEQTVREEVERLFTERATDNVRHQRELEAEIESLHVDDQATVLAIELNQLREAVGQKRVKPALLRAAARDRLRDLKLKDIKPKKFFAVEKREAKLAGRLLRKGDRAGAAKAKFRQLVNFQMAQEAYRVLERAKRQHKFFKKFLKKPKPNAALPIDYRNIIKTLLGEVNLNREITLREFIAQKEVADGVHLMLPVEMVEQDGRQHYTDLTLRDWENLYDTVKTVEHQGLEENRLIRAEEKRTRQEVADAVATNVIDNLKSQAGDLVETNWEKSKEFGRGLRMLLFNTDTLVKEIDGFKSLGAAYDALKRPYDRAISYGYLPGQIGFNARMKQESSRVLDLWGVFSKKELLGMKKSVIVPGVKSRMSHQRILSVLLNSGNLENRLALTESGQFTDAEINSVQQFASERDWQFVQSVWDYLGEFWPDIQAAVKRRQNVNAKAVMATPIETPHGTFSGGYYPLVYDSRESILPALSHSSDVNQLISEMRFGQFVTSHTRNQHTKERVGSGGRAVKLDPFVINSHVNQVVYDLEVGDAVIDIYKILHHKTVRQAFQDRGRIDVWEKLDLWFGDIVMGEMHHGEHIEKLFRHLRTGFVISKLGFNVMTVMFQPLGLLQSMPLLGKYNMIRSATNVMLNWQTFDFTKQQSAIMAQRQANYNREIVEAQQVLKSNLIKQITPGNTAQVISEMAFYGLIKTQMFVDTATWLAAKRQGLARFGDEAKAIEHADRMVVRTQASGIFGDRTQLERGTAGKKFRQSESVRALVPLISYFMAKTNVAYERVRSTNIKNPIQVLDLSIDLLLMYLVEALIVAAIRGTWPEDDDELGLFAFKEGVKAIASGIPGFRDLVSEAEGFRGGGVISSVFGESGRFIDQANQGEIDAALLKSAARLGGTLARVPGTSQIIRTTEAVSKAEQGEDIKAMEFILGPRWKD